ncbi:MAG TPA: bifunctional phosphoribosyl-AMP cyclohydrolase/phosphoribosyl-ATP diphosphatase HisIE [Longimicrobiales bacterium]|nr:bifunctional phosphoribosyl-AMP cyclohydrolase/phosphoribosyl-ATP diphosphatase HisIE [Longimicrobiales bacterium]
MIDLERLDFAKGAGLVPVVAQHADTGEVLLLAYANREALERSERDGALWFYSRSRARLWRKGETSGNELRVVSLHADCDADAVLALVRPSGPACHTGARSCFGAPPLLVELADALRARTESLPGGSYTARLLTDANLRLKKLGEEAVELATALARDDAEAARAEAADLFYHLLVAALAAGIHPEDILAELRRRRGGE